MTQAAILAASGSPGTTTGFKNRIINGNMAIDQRNNGAAITASDTTIEIYDMDRWAYRVLAANKMTMQQVSTAPTGFTKSLKVTSTSAYTVGASEFLNVGQIIEGYNIGDLAWGTASAKTVTLSFWVNCSLTGTFSGVLLNAASDQCYPFTYTVSAANTWEQKSIIIPGSTTATWNTTNGRGIYLSFCMAAGSSYLASSSGSWLTSAYLGVTGQTSLVATNGATWYMTGCQLEVGTTATNFDFRSYGTELALCQRYYQKSTTVGTGTQGAFGVGFQLTATTSAIYVPFIVTPRTFPTVTGTNLITTNNVNWDLATTIAGISPTTGGCFLDVNTVSAGGQGTPVFLRATSNTTGTLAFSAEL